MTSDMEAIHKDLVVLKKDVALIKSMLIEDFELSDHAKKALKEARETFLSLTVRINQRRFSNSFLTIRSFKDIVDKFNRV